jgi:hypothetical protein
MKLISTSVAFALALSLTTPAFAGDLLADAAQAASEAPQTMQSPPASRRMLVSTGGAVFAAGMVTALYGFMRAGNGEFSQFGEATSRNKPLGAAGIAAAFTGGVMMFLGSHASRYMPSTVGVSTTGLSMTKQVSW